MSEADRPGQGPGSYQPRAQPKQSAQRQRAGGPTVFQLFHVEHWPRIVWRLAQAAECSTWNILARGSGHPILDAKRQGWGEHGFRSSVFHVERQARLRGRHGLPGDHFHTLSPRLFHVEHREMARHGRTVSRSPTLAAKARLGWGTRCCSSPAFHVEHSN
jgi:hypothetical protein